MLIYVSLPVHTRPAVIASQLANFAAFLPEARIVLHVSARARFTLGELECTLAQAGCRNAAINGQRVATSWGNILPAHLANLDWIRRHAPRCTRICLHSSNDMLVRSGLARHLERGRNFLHHRAIQPGNRWRFAGAALGDPALLALRRRLGDAPLIGSQVEGSSYDAALLHEVTDLIAASGGQPPPLPYPREEVWLSTVAHACGARPDGAPYVLSEVHRFDRVFWRVLRHVDPLIGHAGQARYLPRRALEFLMIRSGFHRIDRRLVDRIARGAADALAPLEWLADEDDGGSRWRVFDRHGLYGVKRVPRRPDDPLRRYIDLLGARTSPSTLPPEQRLAQPSHEDL
jgi:hypothetical protein